MKKSIIHDTLILEHLLDDVRERGIRATVVPSELKKMAAEFGLTPMLEKLTQTRQVSRSVTPREREEKEALRAKRKRERQNKKRGRR